MSIGAFQGAATRGRAAQHQTTKSGQTKPRKKNKCHYHGHSGSTLRALTGRLALWKSALPVNMAGLSLVAYLDLSLSLRRTRSPKLLNWNHS